VVRANSRRGEATLGGGGAVVNEQVSTYFVCYLTC
jgi:hypothetical protein